ncbi:response regulator [Acinetobacter baumannii]|uniref:response regulator n=3 Tax=Acinetobacter baumannii TaxID=470 RepID=UPI0002BBEC20|nr:response regulator [Acinetobacter baumannii]EHU2134087.1 response regulator [Acinetobacter baumannii]EIG0124858.1 response regulator [Acinetobacter baumannii]EXE53495.1 phosphotransferase enzyme family protein [Acinetobacter baumannii 43926]EYD30260.1 phosphotransferase enzyme family protein [Acinetobacter baumannii 25493_9]EYD67870.1 phosphotransferase enzyme family protein [Acinetobacter baumannii 25493_10]
MNLLYVEDDINWYRHTVEPELRKISNNIMHAANYEQALELLSLNSFDYVITDQSIPFNSSSTKDDIKYGLQLIAHIRESYPSLPILILTGQSSEFAVERFVEDQPLVFFWDGTNKGLIKSRPKDRLRDSLAIIASAKDQLEAIDSIILDLLNDLELTLFQKRVIKLFLKHKNAAGAEIEALTGGYSSAKVLKVKLLDESGNPFLYALGKIDTHPNVDKDQSNYSNYITQLPVGCFPILLGTYFAGCGDFKGVFYQFASNHCSDYFKLLINNQEDALTVVRKSFDLLSNWVQSPKVENYSIRSIRQKICSDSKLESVKEKIGIDLDTIENTVIRSKWAIQHSDLHGKNILVSEDLNPIFIDFGDISYSPAVLDIVTLELSPYFHNDCSHHFIKDLDFFENWFNDSYHLNNSPFPEISVHLRELKRSRCFMTYDYAAVVYGYALRQLTYTDTNHDIAIKLINSAINKFKSL